MADTPLPPEASDTPDPDVADDSSDDGPHALRRLLLATLASLLIHLLVAGGLATTTMGTLAGPARDPAAIKELLKPKVAADFPLQVPQSPPEKAAHEKPQDLAIRPDAARPPRSPASPPRDERNVSRDRPSEPAEKIAASAAPLERSRPPREPDRSQPPATTPVPRQSVAAQSVEPGARADLTPIKPATNAAAAAAKPLAVERQRPADPAAATSQSRQPREVAILTRPKTAIDPGRLTTRRDQPAADAAPAARPPSRAAAVADASSPPAVAEAITAVAPALPSVAPPAPAPARADTADQRRPQAVRAADRPTPDSDEPPIADRRSADAVRAIASGAASNRAAAPPTATLPAADAPRRAAVAGSAASEGSAAVASIAMPVIAADGAEAAAGSTADGAGVARPAASSAAATQGGDRAAAISGGGAAAGNPADEMSADAATGGATPGVGGVASLAMAVGMAGRGAARGTEERLAAAAAGPGTASPGRAAVLADVGPVADDDGAIAATLPADSIAPSDAESAGPVADVDGWQPARLSPGEPGSGAAIASISRSVAPDDDDDSLPDGPTATDSPVPGLTRDIGGRRDADDGGLEAVPLPAAAPLPRVAAVVLPVEGRVREIAIPFADRTRENRLPADRPLIPAETQTMVDRGLEFLARAQQSDGRWSLGRFPGGTPADAPKLQSDTAATGLALLSFLGAGHDHFDGRHRDTVRRGLEFLLAAQKPDGDLYIPSDQLSNSCAWLYSHGIATMALCEAVGMTGDGIVKPAAEKACRFIVAAQHPERGGWRYTPRSDADLSVSGWMLVALRSGRLAGLTIEGQPLDGVRRLLDAATPPSAAGRPVYLYNPRKPDQRPSQSSSACMTALGTLMRMHTGGTATDRRVVEAARVLEASLPSYGTREQKIRDCYLWYYASQVLVHTGGAGWDRWYRALGEQLAARQETAGEMRGSWDPLGAVPDRWGLYGGRIYVTTLHLLTLEVPARRLPTYSVGRE